MDDLPPTRTHRLPVVFLLNVSLSPVSGARPERIYTAVGSRERERERYHTSLHDDAGGGRMSYPPEREDKGNAPRLLRLEYPPRGGASSIYLFIGRVLVNRCRVPASTYVSSCWVRVSEEAFVVAVGGKQAGEKEKVLVSVPRLVLVLSRPLGGTNGANEMPNMLYDGKVQPLSSPRCCV